MTGSRGVPPLRHEPHPRAPGPCATHTTPTMRTATETIYTAAELKEHCPRGYAKALDWWHRVTNDDPAWRAEHSESLAAALAALGIDPPDIEGPRRVMAWIENNVLAHLRIGYVGKERWRLAQHGSAYRPGMIRPCPWTGFCVDDDLLDVIKAGARAGDSPRDIIRAVKDKADALWYDEVESQCEESYFLDACEANGYEFHADGRLA